ncbi:MAG: GDP-mannose 4,6-dehydratase [Xanthobacteraceae bacterium]
MKTALITGISGQDGAYLAQVLLERGYKVVGTHRRTSDTNFWRLRELSLDDHPRLSLITHDVTDLSSAIRLMELVQPGEIYNLAAQTHVGDSFNLPLVTSQSTGIGCLCMLEAIRHTGAKSRLFQASSAEMFGGSQSDKQSEMTPFAPKSPYGAAKAFAHYVTLNYREAYGIYASTGILFNHESPLRGLSFVTRKITDAVARIELGLISTLELGNLDPRRDWGYAKEYVDGFWRALQADAPDDYVFASGRSTTVRDFASMAFKAVGIELEWRGTGEEEVASCKRSGRAFVRVRPALRRPAEVNFLCGDAGKASSRLGWRPSTTLEQICDMMISRDRQRISNGERI